MDATQEVVAALSTDLDAAGVEQDEVKDKLRRLRRRCQILEARQQGEQEPPPLDDDEQEIRRVNSPARKARSLWRARLPHPLPLDDLA